MSIYAVLLGKTAHPGADFFDLPFLDEKECIHSSTWIAQGHFDSIRTYELKGQTEEKNLFEMIYEHNRQITKQIRKDSYFYPMYLIPDSTGEEDHEFWKEDKWFFSAARIHFTDSVRGNETYWTFKETLNSAPEGKKCSFQTYRTVELSDMIVAVKSNRYSDLLDFVLTLRKYPDVGKVFAYCGINFTYILCEKQYMGEEDRLGLLSMRFSVKGFDQSTASQMDEIKKVLKTERCYYTTGMDDIIINCPDLHVRHLVTLYQSWFGGSTDRQELAFTDITASLGRLMDFNDADFPEKLPNCRNALRLQRACDALVERVEKLSVSEDSNPAAAPARLRDFDTLKEPLAKLVHSLARMSRTAIMDEFVYLMLPGVDAFLRNVHANLKELTEKDIHMCRSFIENLDHLVEHVMRIEGQLAHHPDLHPILYDFPVFMLEYTLAFLDRATDILQAEDLLQAKIRFVLIPHFYKRIRAQELYPANIQEDVPDLIMVTIPQRALSRPEEVMRSLCHEVSHFAGESCRLRDRRRAYYGAAASVLMAKIVFQSYDKQLISAIRDELKTVLDRWDPTAMEDRDRDVMRSMEDRVWRWLSDVANEPRTRYSFVKKLLEKGGSAVAYRRYAEKDFWERNEIERNDFQKLLKDLSLLFREVYADICMLRLLPDKTTEKAYIDSLRDELTSVENPRERRDEQIAIQLYVSLFAAKSKLDEALLESIKASPSLFEQIKRIKRSISEKEEGREQLFPTGSVLYLLKYAEACSKKLGEQLDGRVKENGQLESIREMFRNVLSPNMQYERFLNVIEEYRERLLERLADRE